MVQACEPLQLLRGNNFPWDAMRRKQVLTSAQQSYLCCIQKRRVVAMRPLPSITRNGIDQMPTWIWNDQLPRDLNGVPRYGLRCGQVKKAVPNCVEDPATVWGERGCECFPNLPTNPRRPSAGRSVSERDEKCSAMLLIGDDHVVEFITDEFGESLAGMHLELA